MTRFRQRDIIKWHAQGHDYLDGFGVPRFDESQSPVVEYTIAQRMSMLVAAERERSRGLEAALSKIANAESGTWGWIAHDALKAYRRQVGSGRTFRVFECGNCQAIQHDDASCLMCGQSAVSERTALLLPDALACLSAVPDVQDDDDGYEARSASPVPAGESPSAEETLESATALAERYGEAILRIRDVLHDQDTTALARVGKAQLVIAGLAPESAAREGQDVGGES